MTHSDSPHTHTNHLIDETSPYLLQHAHNPVEWYPWGEAAFERARAENKPVFLSIGYAACHWCHVMERESFESEALAEYLNANFVSIKVDREERPDLDDIYMQAVQMLTGSGGWPMTVFMTPDGKPFFGGTYFPPTNRHGHIGFGELLRRIREVWDREPEKVTQNSESLTAAIAESGAAGAEQGVLNPSLLDRAAVQLRQRFDARDGGFGGAPKFPPSMALNLLLRQYKRTEEPDLREMVSFTLLSMSRGGMYDQLGGGFHRYSVDAQWLVPHFEKMLYDNALLAPVLFDAALVTGNAWFERIGRETLDWVLAEMTDPAGGFYSTQDADSEGVEGKYYTWRPEETEAVLREAGFSEEDARLFNAFYDITPRGNWHEAHEGGSILNIPTAPEEFAAGQNLSVDALFEKLAPMRSALLQARRGRVHPGLDDKILTGWNGLMISALARGAQVTGERLYREAAVRAADFLLHAMRDGEGGLLRSWRNGDAKIPAFLEDYANLLVGLIDLYDTTFDTRWIEAADTLAGQMLDRFGDAQAGGFFTTDGRDPSVVVRLKDTYDGATPSGNASAVHGLLRLGRLLDHEPYLAAARQAMQAVSARLAQIPPAHHHMLCALVDDLILPREVAIVSALKQDELQPVLSTLWRTFSPNHLWACASPDALGQGIGARIAILQGKTPAPDQPVSIYVCRNFACAAPVHTAEELAGLLSEGSDRA